MEQTKGPSIFSILKEYKALVGGVLVCALLVTGMNLMLPRMIARAIDAYGKGTLAVAHTAILFGGISLVILVITYTQNVIQTVAAERVARDIRRKLSAKISRQDYLYIERTDPAKLLTNLTSDVDGVKGFVSQAAPMLISSIIMILGASVLLISIKWKLAVAILCILPLIAVTFGVIFSKSGALFKRSREVIDRLNKVINESIMGASLVRVLNAQSTETDKFVGANTEAKTVGLQVLAIFAAIIPIISFVASLATVAILALGGHFVILGTMSLGDFSAFMSYVSMLIFPIIVMGFVSNAVAQAQTSYGRITEVLDAAEPTEYGAEDAPLQGTIDVEHVSLDGSDRPILKDISLHITPKSRTAIIGPTAAGKTQLLYLLMGLIHPTTGEIRYEGKPLRSYTSSAIHRAVGLVFQDSVIFNLSLRENIAFNAGVTEVAMQKAIATAELADFVETLPEGLDTIISERGLTLSGGQKQRIMLARALALDPKVLLLDDFTARVDTATERRILANVQANYPDLTLISVTQKIAPIEDYERIVVLMEGEIIAEGTHTHLMEHSPEYVQIYDSQKSTNVYELQA